MLDIKKVKECIEDAKTTLRLLSKREEERVMISKKKLEGYCNDSIIFCEMILVLLKGTN